MLDKYVYGAHVRIHTHIHTNSYPISLILDNNHICISGLCCSFLLCFLSEILSEVFFKVFYSSDMKQKDKMSLTPLAAGRTGNR